MPVYYVIMPGLVHGILGMCVRAHVNMHTQEEQDASGSNAVTILLPGSSALRIGLTLDHTPSPSPTPDTRGGTLAAMLATLNYVTRRIHTHFQLTPFLLAEMPQQSWEQSTSPAGVENEVRFERWQ